MGNEAVTRHCARIVMNDALRERLTTNLMRVIERPAPAHMPGAAPCRMWQGAKAKAGYGNVVVGDKTMGAHRAAFLLAHGAIPDGAVIGHRCDRKGCIEVSHLEAISQRKNVSDASTRGLLMRKLTPAEIDAIRRLTHILPAKVVAAEFGIATSMAQLIGTGKAHKHVHRPAWCLPGDAMAIARARKLRNGQVQRRVGPPERRHIEAGAEVALVRARLAIDSPAPVIY